VSLNKCRPAGERVSAFSPPESNKTLCRRLPGGEATTSIPLSRSSLVGELHEGVAAAEQLFESGLEVFVDFAESFLNSGAKLRQSREWSRSYSRWRRSGLSLGVEEGVRSAVSRYSSRAHVHRAHGFELARIRDKTDRRAASSSPLTQAIVVSASKAARSTPTR